MQTLRDYAMSFLGVPYRWGGSNPICGIDCSGLVQEILKSVGMDPPGDQTAQGLYAHFVKSGTLSCELGSIAFYGKSKTAITHVAFVIDAHRMIEAGGGGHLTMTREDASKQDAFVRIRPVTDRSDLIAVIKPSYPFQS